MTTLKIRRLIVRSGAVRVSLAFLPLPLSRGKISSLIRSFSLTCVLTFTSPVTGHTSTVQFNGVKTYPVGNTPNVVVAVDLNGDGKLDIAVANLSGTLSVLLGNGDGSFQTANTFTAGTEIRSVTAADLNGDTKPDLIISDSTLTSTRVGVLINNGDGTFGPVQMLPGITIASSFAVSDVDGDLNTDIVVGDIGATVVHVFMGKGDGTFQSPLDFASSFPPRSIHIGDFNGDGRPDLAISGPIGFSLWLGNGDGTFRLPVFVSTGFSSSISPGDLNQDGKTDVAGFVSNIVNGNISFFIKLGNGDGTFQSSTSVGPASGKLSLLADFDGDRVPDVVAEGAGSVFVWINHGDATFQAPLSVPGGATSAGIAAADLNGDGATDLIVTNPEQNTVSVLLNAGTQFSLNTLTLSPSSITRGQSTTGALTVNLLNSFAKPITLSCNVAASGQSQGALPSCSIEPNSVSPAANGSATATLTVNTSSTIASIVPGLRRVLLPIAAACFGLLCLIWDSSRKRRLALFAVFGGLALQIACGSSTPRPSSSYTITVTAKAGAVHQTTSTFLTVQ
jgi:FG-GAP-like repeat